AAPDRPRRGFAPVIERVARASAHFESLHVSAHDSRRPPSCVRVVRDGLRGPAPARARGAGRWLHVDAAAGARRAEWGGADGKQAGQRQLARAVDAYSADTRPATEGARPLKAVITPLWM